MDMTGSVKVLKLLLLERKMDSYKEEKKSGLRLCWFGPSGRNQSYEEFNNRIKVYLYNKKLSYGPSFTMTLLRRL